MIMADDQISFCSFNIAGYDRNKDFLSYLCENNANMIAGLQEHWLKPPMKKFPGTDILRTVHPKFEGFGSSAMKKSMETQIRKGRSFGGTGFVYDKTFAKCLNPLTHLVHERISTLELQTNQGRILVLDVYFPYFDNNNVESQLDLYRGVIGFMENAISLYPNHKVIIMADFNCNVKDRSHSFSKLLIDLMRKHDLISCYDFIDGFDPRTSFTRFDSRSTSLLDGFIFSSSLREYVTNV